MKIGVSAIQGSFERHLAMLKQMGIQTVEVRRSLHLSTIQGLIFPGGETTTYLHLMEHYGWFDEIRRFYQDGGALFGTCAGAILLGKSDNKEDKRYGFIDAYVKRNAYGRQVDSFMTPVRISGMQDPFEAIFIRAPIIDKVGKAVTVLAKEKENPILVRSGRVLLSTFHPELTQDDRVHRYFSEKVVAAG